jgi:hypothetical protein
MGSPHSHFAKSSSIGTVWLASRDRSTNRAKDYQQYDDQ